MLREFTLAFIIATLLFVETEADAIKDLTLFDAGAKFPLDVFKQSEALAHLPVLLKILGKLGPSGINFISILQYFASFLTSTHTLFKIVPFLPKPIQALLAPLLAFLVTPTPPFFLPFAKLLLKVVPFVLLGPTWLVPLFASAIGGLAGFLGPLFVPLVSLFLIGKALVKSVSPLGFLFSQSFSS